jgi:hypothetical protein
MWMLECVRTDEEEKIKNCFFCFCVCAELWTLVISAQMHLCTFIFPWGLEMRMGVDVGCR